MKIRPFIPAFLALFVLLVSPFSSASLCGSKAHGGLAAYCCLDAGKQCPMICCEGCKAKAGVDLPRWMPELIFTSLETVLYFNPVFHETASFFLPETVHIEVPVKPPISA